MFYLKTGNEKLWIEDTNTFTMCPVCGKEIQVSLEEAVMDGKLDLYGVSFCCEKCGKTVRERENNDGRSGKDAGS